MAGERYGDLINCPFEKPVCPAPGLDEATVSALKGGFDLGEGSEKETANMSGLPPVITLIDVKDGPAAGSTIPVEIHSPMPAAANIPVR